VFRRASRKREPPRIDERIDGVQQPFGAEADRFIERRVGVVGLANVQEQDFDAKYSAF
jgi:hypothetical protein